MACSTDLTDAQWNFLEPLLVLPSKRGPKYGVDLRHLVDAMLYISRTGCQWRFLPEEVRSLDPLLPLALNPGQIELCKVGICSCGRTYDFEEAGSSRSSISR